MISFFFFNRMSKFGPNYKSMATLQDYRFITNQFLLKPLQKCVSKYYDDMNNNTVLLRFNYFCPVVNITNLQHVNVYVPITPIKDIFACGCIVTRVHFPKVKTLDDLLKSFISNENIKFDIEKTWSFFFKNEKEQLIKYLFIITYFYENKSSQGDDIGPNDRIFNISAPKYEMEGLYTAFQKENQFDLAEIIVMKNKKAQVDGEISIENHKKNIFQKIFCTKNKNHKKYVKLN